MGRRLGSIMFMLVIVVLLVVGMFSVFKLFESETTIKEDSVESEKVFNEIVEEEDFSETMTYEDELSMCCTLSDEEIEKARELIEEGIIKQDLDSYIESEIEFRKGVHERVSGYIEDNKKYRKDTDEFYAENSQIVDEIFAKDSENVMSESEVIKFLYDRGFDIDECNISTHYDMNGEFYMDYEMSDFSSKKHPTYDIQVIIYDDNDNECLWTISILEDDVIALPLFYNFESEKLQVIFSESNTMTCYSNSKNKFYKTIPNKDVIDLKVIDKIDYDTLKGLTYDVIDNY